MRALSLALTLALVVLTAHPARAAAPKVDPDDVRVFNTPPTEPYERIATVTVSEDDLDEALEELREEAADRGGDGVIVILQAQGHHRFLLGGGEVQLTGDVIRLKGGATAQPGSTPPPEGTPPAPAKPASAPSESI